jgi:GH24 family phage-related lysozyme (muramidase)
MDPIADTLLQAREDLAVAGDWLTAKQRLEVWRHTRESRSNELDARRREALSPYSIPDMHPAGQTLSTTAIDVVHRLASDSGRLTRSWADQAMTELGEETYTELVGVSAIASVVDVYAVAVGEALVQLPSPTSSSEPAKLRPTTVGDVGAWVSQSVEGARANVSRSLSLVPITDQTWRSLVDTLYSHGEEFYELEWDRALNRAQVELVAARTTSLLECFY